MSPSHQAIACARKRKEHCEYCKAKHLPGHNTHHVVVHPKKPKKENVNIGREVENDLPDEFFD